MHPELFVTTSEGVVMINVSPMFPTDAVKWRDYIKKRGEVRYIINTDYHIDHITGNYFFPGTVVSHQGVRDMLAGPITNIVASERVEKFAWNFYGDCGIHSHENQGERPGGSAFSKALPSQAANHHFL